MSLFVFLVVLCAAALNAGWNAAVKAGADKRLDVAVVSAGSALVSASILPFIAQPAAASWPYLAMSVPVQVLYYGLLAEAYRRGDMSEAYPVMRGTAPLLVATVGTPILGEVLTLDRWIGVGLICAGAFTMAVDAHFPRRPHPPAIPIALANAAAIAAYTVIDGIGVRRSGAPLAYVLWIFLLTAMPVVVITSIQRGQALVRYARSRLTVGIFGGAATVGSYGLALWAMTAAPVALVAALRETSILFATVIAVLFLKERIRWPRYLAIGLIALGAVVLRLG